MISAASLRAANTCLAGLDTHVAGLLGDYLGRKKHLSAIDAGELAGKLVARITVYLALVGPVFSTANFLAEQALPAAPRTVAVFPTGEVDLCDTLHCGLTVRWFLGGRLRWRHREYLEGPSDSSRCTPPDA